MIRSTRRGGQTALRSAAMSGNKHVFEAILGVSVGKLSPLEVGLGRRSNRMFAGCLVFFSLETCRCK